MFQPRLDRDACIGIGACHDTAPELFDIHDDGYGVVRGAPAADRLLDTARRAAEACPMAAITIATD
ncbi:MAG: hypothetical protein ABS81_01470 [Pseudonocardia sp. SCN 72-86]|nr:MAG: hypothetical protein ABS81_01470 [Pseudonocardia sp. SCN 72-86]